MAFDAQQQAAAVGENAAVFMQNLTAASKTMQAVTNEMVAMSMDSMKQTTNVFQEVQGARNWGDLVRIQTDFVRNSFDDFARHSRRIAELTTAAPADFAKRAADAVEKAGGQAQAAAKAAADDAKAATVGLDG